MADKAITNGESTHRKNNKMIMSIADKVEAFEELYKLYYQVQISGGEIDEEISNTINKCFVCLELCMFVDDDDDFDDKEIEKCYYALQEVFDFHNLWTIWLSVESPIRAALVYGLVALLYSSHELIRSVVNVSLETIIWNEMDKNVAKPSLLNLFQDIAETEKMFESHMKYVGTRELTLDCMVSGVNLLLKLLQDKEYRIKTAAWRMLCFLIMHVENLNLVHYIVNDGLPSIRYEEGIVDDYLSDKLACIIRSLFDSTVTEEDVEIAEEQALVCFGGYSYPKKWYVCSVLLRLALAGIPSQQQLDSMILAIERQGMGAQIWGETATLMDRLTLLLKRNMRCERKQPVLRLIHMLASDMERVVITQSSLEKLVARLTICFITPSLVGSQVQQLAGKCLLIFLNRRHYSLHYMVYLLMRCRLTEGETSQDLQKLLEEILALVQENLQELFSTLPSIHLRR